MDDDEFQKIQEELDRKRNEARERLTLDEHDQKESFERKVNQIDDAEDFKKRMMDEMNEKLGKIDGML